MDDGFPHPRNHNGGPPDDPDPNVDDIKTADLVLRCLKVLAATLGMNQSNVLKKKQPYSTLSLRQLAIYCLTNDDPDLSVVPPVQLANIIKFDRGTVRDDRAAVEKAMAEDEETRDYVESARELILGVPAVAKGAQRFFITMDIARSKSRTRMLKLREAKRKFDEAISKVTRSEEILEEIGREDLADHVAEIRKKEPFNPAKDGRLAEWLAR